MTDSWAQRRVVVTGGQGLFGCYVVAKLQQGGARHHGRVDVPPESRISTAAVRESIKQL
jgi:nucleoside-diphosphate-sugar epimerase